MVLSVGVRGGVQAAHENKGGRKGGGGCGEGGQHREGGPSLDRRWPRSSPPCWTAWSLHGDVWPDRRVPAAHAAQRFLSCGSVRAERTYCGAFGAKCAAFGAVVRSPAFGPVARP
eukprot:gene16776-biopygen3811